MTTTSSSLEYKIEVQFAEARVTPPPDSRLMSELEYSTREFSIDNKQGHCREELNTFCLWRLDQLEESSPAADALIFPTGLVWRVKNWLQAEGATVNVKDHRQFGAKLVRCKQVFNNAAGEEREIVEAVAKHRMGCLQVTSWHETLATADLLMQLYPGARSLIAVPTRDGARHVRRELVQAHDRWVGLTKARQPVPGHQWVVACYTDLNAVATENWQLVLFLDQSSVLNQRAKRLLGKLADTPHKRYLIGRQPFGDRDQVTQCEAMFGPWIYRQPDHRLRIRRAEVRTPDCPRVDAIQGVEFKRQAFFNNRPRNEYIAAVARACQKGDKQRLKQSGLAVESLPSTDEISGPPGTVVIVESREHARQLQALLKDWTVMSQGACLRGAQGTGVIQTLSSIEESGLMGHTLVLASGDLATIDDATLKRVPSREEFDGLLIDFEDTFDSKVQQLLQRRRRNSQQRGWQDVKSLLPAQAS